MSNTTLRQLYYKFYMETEWLMYSCNGSLVGIALHNMNESLFRLGGEMSVVRLHDAWARFSRQLIIMSAACEPYTYSGIKLGRAPGIRNTTDVIPKLLSTYQKAKYEPKWYDAVGCIDAANRLKIQNLHTISSSFGSVSSPSEELRRVRNYFVHRGKNTAALVRKHPSLAHISCLKLESIVGDRVYPGISRMEYWVNGLRLIAMAAIQ